MSEDKVLVSIVTYKPDLGKLADAVLSAQSQEGVGRVVIVDNGLEDHVKEFASKYSCEYIRPKKNLGYGGAHNLAFQKFGSQSQYFLVLNPDVEVQESCFSELIALMESHPDIVLSTSKVMNPDGSIQRVHKRLPSFQVLFGRRFFPKLLEGRLKKELEEYELYDVDLSQPQLIPNVSGCFMFFRSSAYESLGGFDEWYFMYHEDVDLSRRASEMGPVVYWPKAKVIHHWARGSHKNWRLTRMNIVSVLKYFWKWGLGSKSEVRPFGITGQHQTSPLRTSSPQS